MAVKRASLVGLIVLIAAALGLAACGPSPKARADDFVKYIPGTIGDWERDDKATVRLLNSTVSSEGHVTMIYEGPDDAIAYMVVEAHPSVDAAQVAITSRLRELLLQGLTTEKNRAAGQATAEVVHSGRFSYALFQEDDIVVEIDVIAADEDHPTSDEAFESLLTAARAAFDKVVKK